MHGNLIRDSGSEKQGKQLKVTCAAILIFYFLFAKEKCANQRVFSDMLNKEGRKLLQNAQSSHLQDLR